jgi:archaellum component FlaF (FlaF/FlaG flagellin family)
MGFGNIVGQAVFFIVFLVVIVMLVHSFSTQSKSTNDAFTMQNKRLLDKANTAASFIRASYADGYLSLQLENEGGTNMQYSYIDVYVDGTRLSRTNTSDYWTSCTVISSNNRCGEIGYNDYAWETTDLIGLWHANNATTDASSYGNDGTLEADAAYDTGKYTYAFDLDGSDAYVALGDIDAPVNQTLTVLAWIHPDLAAADMQGIVGSSKDDGFLLARSLTGSLYFEVTNETAGSATVDAGTITTNTWTMVAGRYNGTDVAAYIDGEFIGASPLSGNIQQAASYAIGYTQDGAEYWNGSIDEVMVFNRSLTQAEILQLYRKGLEQNPGLWDPNEYIEIDIPLTLDDGIHTIEVVMENSYKAVATVVT